MKKIIELLKNMLLTIVYPNRILNLFKVKNLDHNSNKILGNDLIVKIVALVLTIAFVIAVNTPETTSTYTETIFGIPLTPVLDENYTHFGSPIPSHVNVILSGDRVQIDLLMGSASNVNAYLDLNGLEPGIEHDDVPIRIEGLDGRPITAIAVPNVVSGIRIAEIKEREFRLELATINGGIFDELDEPTSRNKHKKELDIDFVTIRGPEMLLDEITEVRALFNAINVENEIDVTSYEALIVANNISGVQISEVEIDPGTVGVTVEIYEDLRRINLEVNDNNISNIPSRHNIRNVTANINEIEVWGDFTNMDPVLELPRIRFSDLNDDGRITIEITSLLPEDVYSETTEVEITVVYEVEEPEDSDD